MTIAATQGIAVEGALFCRANAIGGSSGGAVTLTSDRGDIAIGDLVTSSTFGVGGGPGNGAT